MITSIPSRQYPHILAQHGLIPLLERLPIAPESLPLSSAWLRNAGSRLALDSHSTIHIRLTHPCSGWVEDEPVLFAIIAVFDTSSPNQHSGFLRLPIHYDVISEYGLPTVPHEDRIEWFSTQKDWIDESRLDSPEMRLAKYLTAAFDGSIGTASEIRIKATVLIARYSGRRAHANEAFSRLRDKSLYAVDELKPWYVKVTGSRVSIHLRIPIAVDTEDFISRIDSPSDNYRIVMEILNAMLMELLTGGDFYAIFRAGSITADQMTTLLAEGDLPPLRKPCDQNEPDDHWHVCVCCFECLPCSEFREPGLSELKCDICVSFELPSGYYLQAQEGQPGHTDLGDQRIKDRVYKPKPELTTRWLEQARIVNQVRVWLNDDNNKGSLNFEKSEIDGEHKLVIDHLRQTQQGSDERKWQDIYIKQELDEEVERAQDWTGRLYSPYTPSVEAIHQFIFVNGRTRYHAPGNIAVTSNSINFLLGNNPKIFIKAAYQLLNAKSQTDVDQALSLAYKCMAIRCEMDLNNNFRRVGMHETPYLHQLSDALFRGSLPHSRHVPKAVVLQTRDFQFFGNGELNNRPGWKPPRFDYMREQIEKIADRYGFRDQERGAWTRTEAQDNNEEVPFIFSKDSVIMTWTWYDFYEWMANRLQRLNTDCSNHSNARYEDDPVLLKRMNVERFTFALLHIHLYKLDAARKRTESWPGQGLRALDMAGFECLACLRSPFAPSVAHKAHGKARLLGYLDLDDEYPSEQDSMSFSHEYRNVEIETQMANIGRWTEDTEVMETMFDQLQNVRLYQQDFLPNTPSGYPAGLYSGSLVQVMQDLEAQSLGNDQNFKFGDRFKAFGKLPGGSLDSDQDNMKFSEGEGDESRSPVSEMRDPFHTAPDELEEGEILEFDEEELLGTTSRSLPVSQLTSPRRSNLGRGKSTCYVSCPLQILHNITPFSRVLKAAKFRTPVDSEVLRNDPIGNKHGNFFDTLQSAQGMLTFHAGTGAPVPTLHTQMLREACTKLTISPNQKPDKVGVVRGDWEDTNEDGAEFLVFLLQTMNSVTETSGCKNSMKSDLVELEGERREHISNGLQLPKIEEDIDEHWTARSRSGHRSAIDRVHTIQLVEECKCDRDDCMTIERKFEFAAALQLHVTKLNLNTNRPISLPELRDEHLFENINPEDAEKRCPRCEALGRADPGIMRTRLRRIVNQPPLILINIGRLGYDQGTKTNTVKLNKLQDFNDFDLKDWSPRVFSDRKEYSPESAPYHLRAVLYYKHSPPHYVVLIQLGDEHQGQWVMFDDLQKQPVFASAPPLLDVGACETTLLYVSSDIPFAKEAKLRPALAVVPGLLEVSQQQGELPIPEEETISDTAEEGILGQGEDQWHDAHEGFLDPTEIGLPEDEELISDIEMDSDHEQDTTAREPPLPKSPASPLVRGRDNVSLEVAWADLENQQELLEQNLQQLRLREEQTRADARSVARADQTNRSEASRLRQVESTVVGREAGLQQREEVLVQREVDINQRTYELSQQEGSLADLRRREATLVRQNDDLARREDELRQRESELARREEAKASTEGTTVEGDLDTLRVILDRVQPGDYLSVSNIINQHFQNRIFESVDQSERKRRKRDDQETSVSDITLAPLKSPVKPPSNLPPLSTVLPRPHTIGAGPRTPRPPWTPSDTFGLGPGFSTTIGSQKGSTRIPVRSSQRPYDDRAQLSFIRSQSPSKRPMAGSGNGTPLSPSKHKIHRSSVEESVSSTAIQAKPSESFLVRQKSPSRRPQIAQSWKIKGLPPAMNPAAAGGAAPRPTLPPYTTVSHIDVLENGDYWVERIGAPGRVEPRARLIQECPDKVREAEERRRKDRGLGGEREQHDIE